MRVSTPTRRERTPEYNGELRVVVGVDGSECATRALAFAAQEASLRGAELHVVSAYGATPYVTASPMIPLESDHQSTAAAIVDESLAHVHEIDLALVSKGEIRYGSAGRVLVEMSRGATLLVVGSHGRGTAASLLLGSVSEYCVHHAVSPTTIVR